MELSTRVPEPDKLTRKGLATRARILERAADLIYANGVHATNNEQIRRAAGVSGSQLNHYFPTKESLVLAVIGWQAERVLALHRGEQVARFDTIDAFRRWAAFYAGYERAYQEGCSLGSLASEIIKTDLDVHDELASAFEQWRDVFGDGIQHMQRLGRMRAQADAGQLANLLLAAFQGGMLLAQVARDSAPLEDALDRHQVRGDLRDLRRRRRAGQSVGESHPAHRHEPGHVAREGATDPTRPATASGRARAC